MQLCRGTLVGHAYRNTVRPGLCTRVRVHERPLWRPIRAVDQQDQKQQAPSSPPPPNKDPKGDPAQARLDAVLQELKRTGMTAAKAKQLLSAWAKSGVDDPQQLRKLLVKRSLQPLIGTVVQILIDGVASFGGFYLAYITSQSDIPFKLVLELMGNFAGLYYFINAMLELSVASAILYSTYRYGTSAVEVLAAVRQLAGPSSGLTIADKAAVIVNTLKVLQALDEVAQVLQDQYADAKTLSTGSARDSLKNLSALLTLARAKEELGFIPEEYGLSEKQAANIALAFSVYDLNDNGRLELQEIGHLCSDLGWDLNEPELKEAFSNLDTDKSGYINFTEFVSWFVRKSPAKQAS